MDYRDIHRIHRTVSARFGTDYPEHEGEAVNLSPGGILIQSAVRYPPSTPLVIEVRFDGHGPTLVRGMVVRTLGDDADPTEAVGMGISLTHVSEDYLQCLKTFYGI
jgi:hypothetical protein